MEDHMIDIKFLRENPELVKENIRKKFQDEKLALVDEVIELDAERRKTQQEVDDIKANKNKIAITTDLDKKYATIILKLGFKHQLCIFHTKKSLNK